MADIKKELDAIAELISSKTTIAIKQVTESLTGLVEGQSTEEALETLSGINIEYAMGSKLSTAFVAFESGILLSLKNTYSTIVLPEKSLRLLLESAKKRLRIELTSKLSENIMQNVIDGIATGSSIDDVIESINEVTPELATLVNTTYNQFSNTMSNMIIEQLPDDTELIYIGTYDTKTRDECVRKINDSPATKKQILAKYKNFNNELWNCRHKWEEMSSKPESQGFEATEFDDR